MNGAVLVLMAGATALAPTQYPVDLHCPCPCFDAIPAQTPRPSPVRSSERAGPKSDEVLRWNDVALNAIKAERTPPPVAARNLAIVHASVYDAVNAIDRTHHPFYARFSAPAGTSAETAAAVAAHVTLTALYPRHATEFDTALQAALDAVPDGTAKVNGIRLGHLVAERYLTWRNEDSAVVKSKYLARSAPGSWQPTPPDFRSPLLPQWAGVRCFALRGTAEFRPPGPPAVTSEEFAVNFREVKALGAVDSATRTPDQTEIARFWADDAGTVTPPGHWNRIARRVAVQRGTTLAENARLFAMLNVALADAAIACWDCKYEFNFWRPVTAIRAAARLNDPALAADPDWTPLLVTPPFPSYTSGHSTFSGTAAAVLAEFFGTDEVRFTATSDALPGVTRSFPGFRAAAREAGRSRIYGGIHWEFDNSDGLAGGQKMGEYVSRHFFQPMVKVTETPRDIRAAFATLTREAP